MPDKDKKPKPVAVKIGITDYSYTQMVEEDLKANDTLITGEELAQSNCSQSSFPGSQRVGGRRR